MINSISYFTIELCVMARYGIICEKHMYIGIGKVHLMTLGNTIINTTMERKMVKFNQDSS